MKEDRKEGEAARAHLLVAGRVQGVGYRASAQDRAETLEVSGWVRNLGDGSVEVVAEGRRETVERLVEWCRRGPAFARVTDVSVTWHSAKGDLRGFVVKR